MTQTPASAPDATETDCYAWYDGAADVLRVTHDGDHLDAHCPDRARLARDLDEIAADLRNP